MIGQTVSHYRILEKLGEGGMGVVYAAEDTHLGRRVAIKFPASTTGEHNFRARFLREARAVSTLTHHHIAAVYDYGETEKSDGGKGRPFIVMELVKGARLADLMHEGRLTLKRAVEIIADVAEALSEAHHHGVVHRDIKPSNVLVNERGDVKVLDFGLAKQLGEEPYHATDPNAQTQLAAQTRSGAVVGTPLYLSPEQARGGAVDGRSDLFALGALLYECVTGKPAFEGAGILEIAGQVLHVNPPPPSRVNPRVPPALDRIVMKALAKKPEARYQSADAVLADLRAVEETLDDRDAHRTERLSAPTTRHSSTMSTLTDALKRPRLSLGVMLLVIALGAVAVFAVAHWMRPAPYQPSAEARRWYDTGTEALRDGLYHQASKAFEQAIASDEKFALAHARLSEALMELDYVDRAKDELLKVSGLTPDRGALPEFDALYLDAITASVRRDFGGAIVAYGALARLSPQEPQVYVDLGRAYENNGEPKKAIESYIKATALDAQYATAYVRAGVLYVRQAEAASATSAFNRAEQIYQALGKVEGRAEVAYQRSDLFIRAGQIAEARRHSEQAIDLARTINNQPLQIKAMLQLAYVLRHQGESERAEGLASEAVELAQTSNMGSMIARGLNELGSVFFLRGEYEDAEKYFRQGLELARRYKAPRAEARALFALGSLRVQQGNADEALPYIEQALPFYQQGGYRTEAAQSLIMLGRIHRLKGDYEAALKAYRQQLELAEQSNDQRQKLLALEGIGTVLFYQERYPEALGHFEQEYAISKALGGQMEIAYGLSERASTLAQLGRYEEAGLLLDEALGSASRPEGSNKSLLAVIHQARAETALSRRLFPQAREEGRQALALEKTQTDTGVEARRVVGLALALSGAARDGRKACEEALEMATRSKNPWLISRAQLALAEAQLADDDARGALSNAQAAQGGSAHLGQQASEWRALAAAARAAHRLNDKAAARDYASRAAQVLSGLEGKWGATAYSSYLTRPDVQYARRQLDEESGSSR
ncbi:MAG TPA: tetratricopeptide repeat protein [Pyrinomonadaceae bacterium]|jgi:serine/threonine protein kinase/Flp pilus assembly protein TadD